MNPRHRPFLASILLLAGMASGQCGAGLSTTYAFNNGQAGNMFDVVAQNQVSVCGFDVNLDAGTFDVEIYTLSGTWVGNQANPWAWTHLGTAYGVVSNGPGVATPLPITLNQPLYPTWPQAFYISAYNMPAINYSNGTAVGNVAVSDGNLQVLEGAGVAYPFGGSAGTGIFQPRVWSGTIRYTGGLSISAIYPTSAAAGGPAFTLSVGGQGFTGNSYVLWDGNYLATSYQASNWLDAQVPASLIASAGTAQITVHDPWAGTSAPVAFPVLNAAPVLSALSPSSVTAGGPAFTLAVSGQGFIASSVVQGGGVPLATAWLSSSQLQAAVPATMIAAAGTLAITVSTPAPGGGNSTPLALTVSNPPILVTGTSPSTVPAGSPSFTMIIDGAGFASGHVAKLDGTSLATTVVSSSRIHAVVPAASVSAATARAVTVFNPAGSQTSAAATLTVRPVVANSHEIFSVDGSGSPADADAASPSVSRDGRFVAFHSAAANLVPGDTNGRTDVFVRDRLRLVTTRVSVSAFGAQANGDSLRPSLSANGRWVLFTSGATNLVPGAATSGSQVFRADRDSDNDGVYDEPGTIPIEIVSLSLVSINPIAAGNAPAESFFQGLSEDGRKAVFQSRATDLVATPLGGSIMHVFVRDWTGATPVTVLASATSNATVPPNIPANGSSFEPAMAGGGAYVAFQTDATNLFTPDTNGATDVVRKALSNPKSVTLASRATGSAGAQGNGPSRKAAISASGQWIAFESDATNLGPAGIAGTSDVFRRDLSAGATLQVSLNPAGLPALGPSEAPAISPTGCVAFRSRAGDLFAAPGGGFAHVFAWDLPGFPPGSPPHVPLSMYSYPYGPMGNANSGLTGIAVSAGFGVVAFASSATNISMSTSVAVGYSGATALVIGAITPFAGITAPPPAPDDHPVSFSVNGPVDPHTEGLAGPRGGGVNGPFGVRLPPVPPAIGLVTPQPGDVRDSYVASEPSEAELFQSEPENPGTAPAGTDNQIVIADELGLVAAFPAPAVPPYRDNVDGMSFGEDWFGVTGVSPVPVPAATPWGSRTLLFAEPVVTADSGTSFRFSVDPWALGLPPTAVFAESLGGDAGAGLGPWFSVGNAAGDVFGTPVLVIPFPAPGINVLVHDNVLLALSAAALPTHAFEDDLDALECVGANDWGGVMREPGSMHARVLPLEPTHGIVGDLAPPAVANHLIGPAPVFFTVDRNSTGAADSAVRSQFRLGHAAADVFMAWMGTNLLLVDEQEAGLYRGLAVFGLLQDDMDALLLWVDPAVRERLTDLATQVLNAPPTYANSGLPTQFRTGPGFTTSLLRHAASLGTPLVMKLGFSVTTDSAGLQGTAVDFEAGLDPSGTMQQSGDIFYTEFGPGTANPAPAAALGMNWLWHDEVGIGLDAGAWVLGASTDLALLPDELNALDSLCSETYCPGVIATHGYGSAGSGGFVPALTASGWASPGSPVAFTLTGGLGGAAVYASFRAAVPPFAIAPVMATMSGAVSWCDNVGLLSATIVPLPPLSAGGPGAGTLVIPGRIDPATPPGTQLLLQLYVVDPAGPVPGGLAPSNGLFLMVP